MTEREEHCDLVAIEIERMAEHFDMSRYSNGEGYPTDIAGAAAALAGIRDLEDWDIDNDDIEAAAGGYLFLKDEQRAKMFRPTIDRVADWRALPGTPGHITADHAAAVVRRYGRTGIVNWEDWAS